MTPGLLLRHEAAEMLPKLTLCDLIRAQEMTPGTMLVLARYTDGGCTPFAVRFERRALDVLVGADLNGRRVQFYAANVLRLLWRPA